MEDLNHKQKRRVYHSVQPSPHGKHPYYCLNDEPVKNMICLTRFTPFTRLTSLAVCLKMYIYLAQFPSHGLEINQGSSLSPPISTGYEPGSSTTALIPIEISQTGGD